MTPEEERIRELQRRAANNDKEAQTMLALMSDRPEPAPDPRIGIQNRATEAYSLPEIDLQQQRANIATDTAAGTASGTDLYEDRDKWRGKGLIGTPFAALMNQTRGQKDKKQSRIDADVTGLRRAREATRLAAEQTAKRQGNIAANRSVETRNTQEAGQDFTVGRYSAKRADDKTDLIESRQHTAGLLKAKQEREDRIRGEIDPLKPTGTQTSDYESSKGALDSIGGMNNQRTSLSAKDKRLYTDAMRDIGTSLAPAWAKGIVAESAYGGSSAVQSLRAEERKAMAEFRRLISGKQVTGPEFLREVDWSPTAAGLTLDERQRRWDIMERETQGTVGRHEETFKDYVTEPYAAPEEDERINSMQSEIDRINAEADELERARQ